MTNDVSISVNSRPLSAKLASFMTRSIVDWFSELVFYKSQIGPGRKIVHKITAQQHQQSKECGKHSIR